MTTLVLFVLIFLAAGATLLAANLVIGRFVRPDRPNAEKAEVYECGEEPIGDAWVQFDLRFYVVALLFVIFDVELAFFFPWAVVFGVIPLFIALTGWFWPKHSGETGTQNWPIRHRTLPKADEAPAGGTA